MIGWMSMPVPFEYEDVYRAGPPVHRWTDAFRLKHPAMEPGRRAKIFAPFDALDGFDARIAARQTVYEPRREPGESEREELNRRLGVLARLTRNSRAARENAPEITVVFYVPCEDPEHEARGRLGRYLRETGVCRQVTPSRLLLGSRNIPLADILSVEGSEALFPAPAEAEAWEEATASPSPWSAQCASSPRPR